jgi:MFS family permease
MLRALKNRDFALLWAGMTVSLVGDGIYFVAIAWEAFQLSDAPTALALVGVAWTLPAVLCLLFGGVLSDRFDRRRLLIGTALAQAVAIGLIALLATLGVLTLWLLLFPVAVYGGLMAIFAPAFEAIIPTLVGQDQLLAASAVEEFIRPVSIQLLGPAVGGILIALAGTTAAFLADSATFVLVAFAVLAMRPTSVGAARAQATGNALSQIREGIRFVAANPWLWRTLLAAAVALLAFVGPSQVLLPYLVKNDLHGGSEVYGAIRAAGGIGALLAAAFVGFSARPAPALRPMFAAWALQCFGLAAYALANRAWVFGLISLLSGALGAIGNIVWGTLIKERVPNELLGRVSSVDWLVSIGLVPLSFAVTGPIAEAAGARTTMIAAGALASLAMVLFLLLPGSRRTEALGGVPDRNLLPLSPSAEGAAARSR